MNSGCEVVIEWGPNNTIAKQCDGPVTYRYPAMGGGYMHLCEAHGAKHAGYAEHWVDGQWTPPVARERA